MPKRVFGIAFDIAVAAPVRLSALLVVADAGVPSRARGAFFQSVGVFHGPYGSYDGPLAVGRRVALIDVPARVRLPVLGFA